MKTMKMLLTMMLLGLTMAVSPAAMAADPEVLTQGDSVIVKFGKGGRMVLYMTDPADWEAGKSLDFSALLAKLETYVDSAKQQPDGRVEVEGEWGMVRVYADRVEVAEESNELPDVKVDTGDGIRIRIVMKGEDAKPRRVASYTDLYFGLNGYLEDGDIPDGTAYDLRPTGSRYFGLAFRRQARLGGEKSPFYLNYAIAFSWYNFMFDGNNMAVHQNGQVSFPEHPEFVLRKSKLSASYINLPLMLKFKRKNFSLAAGGYVGYRLGSHSKVKYLDERGDWQKDKEHGNFGLENVRYGLQAELNWVGPTLFASYDLNPLFTENSGAPRLNAFTFGIKL